MSSLIISQYYFSRHFWEYLKVSYRALVLLGFAVLFIHLLYIQTTGNFGTLGFSRLFKYGLLIGFAAVVYPNINPNTLAKILVFFFWRLLRASAAICRIFSDGDNVGACVAVCPFGKR